MYIYMYYHFSNVLPSSKIGNMIVLQCIAVMACSCHHIMFIDRY